LPSNQASESGLCPLTLTAPGRALLVGEGESLARGRGRGRGRVRVRVRVRGRVRGRGRVRVWPATSCCYPARLGRSALRRE